jgi:hypothetical protein
MFKGSKGFGGFSGLLGTGVKAGRLQTNRCLFFVVNYKELAMLKWARLSYASTTQSGKSPESL